MALSQDELVKRADVTVQDMKTNGGYLNPARSDVFMREITRGTDLLPLIRVIGMTKPDQKIDKIGIGTPFLHKAPASGIALDAAKRAKPVFSQVPLTTTEMIGSIYLPYDVIEDNIERGTLSQTIMAMIIARAQEDLELNAFFGDSTSLDTSINSFDGFYKQATSHIVDNATPVPLTKDCFKAGLKAMPSKFLRNRGSMAHFIGPKAEIDYADSLTVRQTALGDSAITNSWQGNYAMGVPVRPASVMPDDKGMFCDPKNLILGIWRQIQIESARDIETRMHKIVMTLRAGTAIEEKDAVVRYSGWDVD